MAQQIRFRGWNHKFQPLDIQYGGKKISPTIARENLLAVRSALLEENVRWCLAFGTLLGAVRDGNFIPHDEDTDVFIFREDRKAFFSSLQRLISEGFEVARHEPYVTSVIRNNEYVDFYFIRRFFRVRKWTGYSWTQDFFDSLDTVQFLSHEFPTPKDPHYFLEHVYGPDWQIPRSDYPAPTKESASITLIKKVPALARFAKRLWQKGKGFPSFF